MNYKMDFVKYRKIYFFVTLLIVVLSFASLLIQGLNLGIDFVSGTRLDISLGKAVQIVKAKEALKQLGYENPNARVGGKNKDVLIFRLERKISKDEVEKIEKKMNRIFQTKSSVQEQTVDPIVGRELAKNAVISVLIASIGIILYVTFRFEYRFAVAAILTLLYDAVFAIGMFSLFQIEVDLYFIVAILTIVGYSVMDSIVIFDRIRENLQHRKLTKWEDLSKVANDSIHQTLVRSINTVLTVVFAALALYLFGGESISNFSLALLLGIISGAYSSIFIASQIWIGWKWRSIKKGKSENELVAG